ncbi:hypothetical protein HN592_00570 [Candidatus Woesearchaeota archaeon]|mgnify:CR=1 FL=1|jgi:parvulin-like peptidyl-prolyl isomerase|nr:hypothetical protein [Candidatus Woesearchaeota archaeon]MBT4368799.1 hypothetical protein [Candidatus Woesearchaeota archaeon]MBT4712088.1 hypothetical protein [Candidatus Woesearchaeota archaeon]MBT6639164.1 hypothetical protein [Candidatus Woesearchaeota archaeon]MBT7134364.1 hypothetical protein [Candidatus Woesearchaeota archaeon]
MNTHNPEDKVKVEEKNTEENTEVIYEDDFEEPKSSKKGWIVTGVVIVLLLIAFLVWANASPSEELDVLAFVNGQPVYAAEIDARFEQLPAEYKDVVDRSLVLNQTIDEILLVQEAITQGIEVNEEELTSELNTILQQSMMSKEQFEEYLVNNGLDLETALNQIEVNLVLRKLLSGVANVSVSEEEVEFYYAQNKNLFKTLESRKVSHILICYVGAQGCEANYTNEQATELVNEVLEKTKTEDFASLAKEYSTGPSAPTGGSLGSVDETTNFVPEFKAAALDLNAGEVSGIVETDFGFHIIKVSEVTPANTVELAEVSPQIEAEILNAKTSQFVGIYLATLREKADIQFITTCDVEGVIFYSADWCDNCEEADAVVNELIAEGRSITKVMVSDNDLVKTCFGAIMKEQIPQFICGKEAVVGQLSKEEIVTLVEKCD